MATRIFVNLPVKDLPAAKRFWAALGYSFDPRFTNDTGGGLIISDTIFAMLLTEPFFKGFAPGGIADTSKVNEVLIALSFDSREEVDAIVAKAVAAGGRTYSEPKDHGFMYQHGFQDLDGHVWEVFWMDPNASPAT